ncbi:MAG: cytochrome P450 [Streptosporangiales bacterium]|nr:cytochrome P450 [Streptosporangiales bacterium]
MDDPELMRDPYRGYSRIRERAPLVRAVMAGSEPVWLVTRYADVKGVLTDRRFVVDPANVPGAGQDGLRENLMRTHRMPQEYVDFRKVGINTTDGADHARLRGHVRHALTARRVAGLRTRITEITEALLDRLPEAAEDGVVDLLHAFAYPLTMTVSCELVGVPETDRSRWFEWHKAINPTSDADKAAVWPEVIPYVRGLIERRRAEPADDLITALIRAQAEAERAGPDADDAQRITEVEMISLILTLGLTSQQTAHLVGGGALALATHPDQLALLRDDPELAQRAVHEILRWCTPTVMTPRVRYATEDLEIGGMPVRKGEAVALLLVAADWDPREFDDPERLDLTREPRRPPETHLAFGAGPRYCSGAALARLEGEIALTALVRRHPRLTLAVPPSDLEYAELPGMWRILMTLPVRL